MIKAVFLDIDNTLLDFDAYVRQTLRTGFAEFDLAVYEPYMYDVFTEVNNGLWRRIEDDSITFEELKRIRFRLVFEKLGIHFDGPTFETYFRHALNESAIPVDGAYDLLEELHGNYRLYAASNGPCDQQMHRLELADMAKYFDDIFISEKVGAAKPSQEFYDYAFRKINRDRDLLHPEECIAIGDSLTSDVAGGINCGMYACWYRHGSDRPIDEDQIFAGRGFAVSRLDEIPGKCEDMFR